MRKLIITLPLVALLCHGCGTMASHDGSPMGINRGVYRGVRYDCDAIAHADGCAAGSAPFYAIDMPLSLAADTICLPFDVLTLVMKPETENPEPSERIYPPP